MLGEKQHGVVRSLSILVNNLPTGNTLTSQPTSGPFCSATQPTIYRFGNRTSIKVYNSNHWSAVVNIHIFSFQSNALVSIDLNGILSTPMGCLAGPTHSLLRTSLIIMLVTAMGGAWLLEQPSSSQLTWLPCIRFLWRVIPQVWGVGTGGWFRDPKKLICRITLFTLLVTFGIMYDVPLVSFLANYGQSFKLVGIMAYLHHGWLLP